MIITRKGKCQACGSPVSETKTFAEVVNMFEPDVPKGTITKDIGAEIIAWKKRPLRCEYHQKGKK